MSEDIYVIRPKKISNLLSLMIHAACNGQKQIHVIDAATIPDLANKRLLLAVELNEAGYCIPILEMISQLYKKDCNALTGSKAVLLIYSPNDFNTKSTATDIIFQLNLLGCQFPGHPVVEAIGSLNNFRTWQKTLPMTLEEICLEQSTRLGERLIGFQMPVIASPYIVVLHSSSSDTSNTLALWNMVKSELRNCRIEELHVENGTILDCNGCTFKTCSHYSKQSSCFYGGVLVEEIYPAIEKADAVVWICPNYNDAVSANISAVINRLTALYRKTSFSNKALYAVVVSGNSGSDSVAMQLLDSLCINKGFYLPSNFCITATANDPGSILKVRGIKKKAKVFAQNMFLPVKVNDK
ncbi:MAG: NAD(P)H-dependent oxidoreductase [Clostridia bacterium]|jgi:multimeric flavodoxin WrbA|nr:NAD(P)H-dependent oxidoreductase [Clostridia bacterium]